MSKLPKLQIFISSPLCFFKALPAYFTHTGHYLPANSFLCYLCSAAQLTIILTNLLTVACLTTSAFAHCNHGNHVPIAVSHKALWYNTLPGDGGPQGGHLSLNCFSKYDCSLRGQLGLLWHLDIRSSAILLISCLRRCEI